MIHGSNVKMYYIDLDYKSKSIVKKSVYEINLKSFNEFKLNDNKYKLKDSDLFMNINGMKQLLEKSKKAECVGFKKWVYEGFYLKDDVLDDALLIFF